MTAGDAERIFTGIADSYDRVATVLSLGQDPRWRRTLVEAIDARPTDRVLDVATGTGMVAHALRDRFGCVVVGLDQSADMLRVAQARAGVFETIVEGRAERLPFRDASFDHLTFAYLLRYVDDPAATMRELARVVKPGGRVAMVEFGLPGGVWRPAWWLYTRIGLPLAGRVVSAKWSAVGSFLGPNIERFYARHPVVALERYWFEAGLVDVHTRRMSLGGGVVMSAVRRRRVRGRLARSDRRARAHRRTRSGAVRAVVRVIRRSAGGPARALALIQPSRGDPSRRWDVPSFPLSRRVGDAVGQSWAPAGAAAPVGAADGRSHRPMLAKMARR